MIRKDGNKKCLVVMCFILLFTLVLSISIAIAFPLEIIKLTAEIDELEAMLTGDVLGQCESFPVLSCTTLPPSLSSGYYWVLSLNGTAMRVFCEMERSCGGITGGWTRVVKLDMANSSHQCPGDLRQRTDSNIRTCVNSAHSPGCSSTTFDVEHGQYSMICGRVIAFQFGTTDAFGGNRGHSIDSNYVDGVSLTHGSPRSHIWTFAAALDEQAHYYTNASSYCPCINSAEVVRHVLTPAFVMTTFVILVVSIFTRSAYSIVKILYGMGWGVVVRAAAAASILLRGSTRIFQKTPPMTLKCECAGMKTRVTKILELSWLKFTFSRFVCMLSYQEQIVVL